MKRKSAPDRDALNARPNERQKPVGELFEPRDWRGIEDREEQALWKHYAALPQTTKNDGARRLGILLDASDLVMNGYGVSASATLAGRRNGVSTRTIFRWRAVAGGWNRRDWLAALSVMRDRGGAS